MASESIITYKKPGFPITSNSEKTYQTTIEYVGPLATLAAAEPPTNSVWGDYDGVVSGSNLRPIEGTDRADLTVTTEYNYDVSSSITSTAREISYEIEWVMYQRSLLEHPAFAKGGTGAYALTDVDVAAIEAWKNEPSATLRGALQYTEPSDGMVYSLNTNPRKFAEGYNLGIENYEDYVPVARKSTTYAGGLPGVSAAGQKDTPPGIPGLPSGYEWRKTADRSSRSGKQTRWERIEEWTGSEKVFLDKDEIFW